MSNLVIPDDGNIGSASDPDALAISSSGIVTMASGNGYRFNGIRTFTSTGDFTFTKSTNVSAILVYVTGAGGGGAGGQSTYNGGGSGGAGATAIKWLTSGIDSGIACHVGAKGAKGAHGSGGSDGANSTFGPSSGGTFTQIVGGAGKGGTDLDVTTDTGCLGGTATGGDLNLFGGDGHKIYGGATSTDIAGMMGGGASFWGGGGATGSIYHGSSYTQFHGEDARAYGAGGGAGRDPGNSTGVGGDGAHGIIVVYEYI